MADPAPISADKAGRNALAEARGVAAGLPDLLVEARRIAASVLAGWHGRRTAGRGETFWQFRQFVPGEAASSIDWRRSARDDHLYVREKEWEAVHTVWLWLDLSASMDFRSRLSDVTKLHRAAVLTLAVADMLSAGGERVGLLGGGRPVLSRRAAELMAMRLAAAPAGPPSTTELRRFTDVVLVGDFLDPLVETEATLEAVARTGARAHLIQIVDPIEETFPYRGRTEFHDPESGTRHVVSRAEQYRGDYHGELAALRDHLGTVCGRLDWSFFIHRTDRPATEPLLTLHARLADRTAGATGYRSGQAA